MKRYLYLIAVLPLLFTGCGNNKRVVLDGTGGEYYVSESSASLHEKVKPDSETSGDEVEVTRTPKKKDEGDIDTSKDPGNPDTTSQGETGGETSAPAQETPDGSQAEDIYKYRLEGIVLQTDKDTILLNEDDLRRVELKCSADQIKNIKAGDKIEVRYDGVLAAGYPQKGEAYSVEVTAAAAKKHELKRFTYRDLYFSVLVPEDWKDRVIDYPQEGDFTDWGVRIQPEGATGNIDISWHSSFAIRDPFDKQKKTLNGNNVTEYSKEGKWKFLEYTDASYIVNNNFFGTIEFEKYKEDIDTIISTLEFI